MSQKTVIYALAHIDREIYIRIAASGGEIERKSIVEIKDACALIDTQSEKDREFLEENAAEEFYYLNEVKLWSHGLALVALYHSIEVKRKGILEAFKEATIPSYRRNKKSPFYQIDKVIKFLESGAIGIRYSSINSQSIIEELRVLVNNIKHSGLKVGAELSNLNPTNYPPRSQIKLELGDIARFSNAAVEYLRSLSAALCQKIS